MKKTVCFVLVAFLLLDISGCSKPQPQQTETETKIPIWNEIPTSLAETENLLDVIPLCQYPDLPTGCEATAAAMVLQYYGEQISPQEFAKKWLDCSKDFYTYNGKQYGPDPNQVFAGDPFSKNSYGCFPGAIANAINHHSSACVAVAIKDQSLEELCKEFIDRGAPLLIWATIGMKQSSQGNKWFLQNGQEFTWIAGEHCLVLTGYNEKYYFLNDPTSGSTVAYQKHVVEKRFEELGRMALSVSLKIQ